MEDGNRLIYLALDINGVKESSILHLIDSYFADELLEQHLCDSCKSEETAVARKIANCPPVLTFALKRYRGDSRAAKCRNIVHPLIAIDLEKHMTDKRSTLYRLRAIIIHKGKNLNGGHYTSLIISENLKIEVDDHNVSLSDFQSFNSTVLQDGYIFIYGNEAQINELTSQWRPLTLLLIVFCTINFTARSKLFDLFSSIAKLFFDFNNNDVRVKLFDFAAGQLTRHITARCLYNREMFMMKK